MRAGSLLLRALLSRVRHGQQTLLLLLLPPLPQSVLRVLLLLLLPVLGVNSIETVLA